MVGPIGGRSHPGGLGVDADHRPGRGVAGLDVGQTGEPGCDLGIEDDEVVGVQRRGLLDHRPGHLLADLSGLEQPEHARQAVQPQRQTELRAGRGRPDVAGHADLPDHRQRRVTVTQAHHCGTLSMQRRDLGALLSLGGPDHPIQGRDRIDAVGTCLVNRVGPKSYART